MFKKGKHVFCVLLVLLMVALVPLHIAKAEELGELEHGKVVVRFRWIHRNGIGNVVTYVNGDVLASQDQAFKNQLTQAASNWTNNKSLAACFMKSYSESNVDLLSSSVSNWKDLGGIPDTVAITVPTDTENFRVYNNSLIKWSNGLIKRATIYFNPTPVANVKNNPTLCLFTIVHEIGHVYGMGHVNLSKNVSSIMKNELSTQTALTAYDVQVLDSFYR